MGFVNEGRPVEFGPPGLRRILDLWLDAGADLGNHSYSHLNIYNVPLEQYTGEMVRNRRAIFGNPSCPSFRANARYF